MTQSIIFFDGVCNLCNRFVRFVIAHDRSNAFKFGSLQSEPTRALLATFSFDDGNLSTVVLLQNGVLYTRSTAALRVLKELGGIWKLFYAFIVVPAIFRDAIYNIIAKHRYRIFGKRETCMVPVPELKTRFIDS